MSEGTQTLNVKMNFLCLFSSHSIGLHALRSPNSDFCLSSSMSLSKKLPVSSLLATDSCSVSQLLGSCLWIRKYPPKKRHRAQQTPCVTFLFGSLGQLSPTILGNSQMTSKRSFFVCIFSSLCSWWIVYWIWVCK